MNYLDEKLIEKYSQPIADVEAFLEGKRNSASRKPWLEGEREKWKLRHPECPICGQDYSKTNGITKEHIHPISLGGFERAENIIALCHKCNSSRNDLMFSVLSFKGRADLKKRWPANRTSVIEFIIWCHATIYQDHSAIIQFPHLNEAFEKKRGVSIMMKGNSHNQKQPSRLSNRVSKKVSNAWGFMKEKFNPKPQKTNLQETLKKNCQKCEAVLKIPIEYKGSFRCPKCKFIHLNSPKSNNPEKEPPKSNNPEKEPPKSNNPEEEEFSALIFSFIGDEQISSNILASRIKNYQIEEGWDKTGKRPLLSHFKFSIGKTYKQTIEKYLSDKVEILGERPHYEFKLKRSLFLNKLHNYLMEVISAHEDEWVKRGYLGNQATNFAKQNNFSSFNKLKEYLGYKKSHTLIKIIEDFHSSAIIIRKQEAGNWDAKVVSKTE